MDVGVVRFAVPADWVATMGANCVLPPATGVVLLRLLTSDLGCDGSPPLPADRLVISAASGEPPTSASNVQVGRFDAWQLPDSAMATYRLTNGIEIATTGPDSAQILGGFTDSGAVRVLQNGPVTETTDWKSVVVAGVSMLVPPSWDVLDLAHQDFSHGFAPNPGTCRDAWFVSEDPRVFIGEADPNIAVGCVAVDRWPITAVDGIWAREIPSEAVQIGPVIAHGTTGGLDISVVGRTLPDNDSIDPVLDLIIHASGRTVRVNIGVGPDATIARTILHSLHSS
ncbi:MAG: hypothetical protein ACXV6M_12900 [Ilumatobacteraceae bacterium]